MSLDLLATAQPAVDALPGQTVEDAAAAQAMVVWTGVPWSYVLMFGIVWEVIYQASKAIAVRRYADYPNVVLLGASYATAFINALACSIAGTFAVASLLNADEAAKALVEPTTVEAPAASMVVWLAATSFLGWLLSDLFHIVAHYPSLGGFDMLLHHACYIVLAIIGTGLRIAPFVVGWLLMGEISSLFLNVRWLLINTDRGDTRALKRTEYGFAASFFFFRVVVGVVGMVHVVTSEVPFLLAPPQSAPRWAIYTLCGFVVCGAVLNAFWLFKIVRMATRAGPPPKKSKSLETSTLSPRRDLALDSMSDTDSQMSVV